MSSTTDNTTVDRTPSRTGAAADTRARQLQVRGLSVRFRLPHATVEAVTDVSFDLEPGRCLALVGESGCGKSVLVAALLGLLPGNADVAGTAVLSGPGGELDLLRAPERVLARQVRGRQVGLVPQSPTSHLTPVRTVRGQLEEVLRTLAPGASRRGARTLPRRPHRRDRTAVRAAADATARRAGLPPGALDHYPHELSGGMAQRAVTTLALAGDPWLLLADEPTTGLDRPLVEHTLDELRRLTEQGAAVLLITHDLDAAARVADNVAVMYASRVVERGPVEQVMTRPHHPYARGLLDALPRNGFRPVPGLAPELSALPAGCTFAPRCGRETATCSSRPTLAAVRPRAHHDDTADQSPLQQDHLVACHHPC